MGTAVQNWWTTIAGVFGGVSQYMVQWGPTLPQNKGQWASFVMGLALAGLGILAKDGVLKKPTP